MHPFIVPFHGVGANALAAYVLYVVVGIVCTYIGGFFVGYVKLISVGETVCMYLYLLSWTNNILQDWKSGTKRFAPILVKTLPDQ
jgi:hypothetical protein